MRLATICCERTYACGPGNDAQQYRSSNQVTIRPPRRRDPHRTARAATSWSPRPPSALRLAGRSFGVPGPARSVTSTRTMPFPILTATVTVSPGTPEPLCRRLLAKSSLTRSTASSPQGCPGPRTAPTNERTILVRSASPATFTLSRTVVPVISAPPSRPPWKTRRGPSGRTGIHAHLSRDRQAECTSPAIARKGNRARLPHLQPAKTRQPDAKRNP